MIIIMLLRSFIYGGIDGIITQFNIISSIEGAKLNINYLIIIALSVLISDAMSMGISDYLSSKAAKQLKNNNDNDETPIKNGVVTFGSFIAFGLIPLVLFINMNKYFPKNRYKNTVLSMTIAFFIIGSIQAIYTKEIWYISGVQTVLYGMLTSLLAYTISNKIAAVVKPN